MAEKIAPWKRPPPPGAGHTKLTPELRRLARARAKAAGRRYPNLVDNMWAAQQAQKHGR
jgi:hypothetical protein